MGESGDGIEAGSLPGFVQVGVVYSKRGLAAQGAEEREVIFGEALSGLLAGEAEHAHEAASRPEGHAEEGVGAVYVEPAVVTAGGLDDLTHLGTGHGVG